MPNIKLYIYGFLGLVLLTAAGSAYMYYNWSQNEIKTLRENNAILTTAVSTQKQAIASLETDAAEVGKQVILVSTQFRKARSERNKLRQKLAKHDIAYLAYKKPGLVQKIVTKATNAVGRCFEILSGSPLTEKEKTATKKSQINSSCSDIANPMYKVKP